MFSSFVTSIQHWFRGFRQGLSRKLIKIGVVPPPVEENAHLTEEQREMLQKLNFLTLRRPGGGRTGI